MKIFKFPYYHLWFSIFSIIRMYRW